MIVVGLTGSIGMGKSATARLFAEEGARVFDSDAVVHELYGRGGRAVAAVAAAFPGSEADGAIDRAALARLVAGRPKALARLEAIVHPLVGEARERFLAQARAEGADVAVLDIPLLFETGQAAAMDAVVVVSAPEHEQRRRVLARPGMTEARFEALLGRQLPDARKRARADFVVTADRGPEAARAEVRQILATLRDPAWRGRRGLAAPGEQPHG